MSLQPRRYMSKGQRACDFCRARKSACRIESAPPCRNCELHSTSCTFLDAPTRRRRHGSASTAQIIASGDSATQMPHQVQPENAFYGGNSIFPDGSDQLMWEPMDFDEFIAIDGTPLDRHTIETALPNNEQQDLRSAVRTNIFGNPPENNNPSEVQEYHDGSQLTSPARRWNDPSSLVSIDDIEDNAQYVGATSDQELYLLLRHRRDPHGRFRFNRLTLQAISRGAFPVYFWLAPQSLFHQSREEAGLLPLLGNNTLRRELESIIAPAKGRRLIGLFDRFIAPQYPIFSVSSYPDPETSPPQLLAALYVCVLPFVEFDDNLSIELAYDQQPTSPLLQIAMRALAYETYTPTLSVVQTLILLVTRPSTNPRIFEGTLKWNLMGILVTSAQTLGLHLDPTGWSIADEQISLRRRISHVIYLTETWMACALGKPPIINPENWLVTSLTASDNHATSIDATTWEAQLQFSRLTGILRRVLSDLYTLQATHALVLDHQKTLGTAESLLQELDSWHQDALQQVRNANDEASQKDLSRENALGFFYVQINIHRAILRPVLAEQENTSAPQPGYTESARKARSDTQQCLAKAVEFVQSLKPEDVLVFWPAWTQMGFSSIGVLIILMLLTSDTQEEARKSMLVLQQLRKELKVKSIQMPVLRIGLIRIDSVFWKGFSEVFDLEPHIAEVVTGLTP